jgi:hypothetical protein
MRTLYLDDGMIKIAGIQLIFESTMWKIWHQIQVARGCTHFKEILIGPCRWCLHGYLKIVNEGSSNCRANFSVAAFSEGGAVCFHNDVYLLC